MSVVEGLLGGDLSVGTRSFSFDLLFVAVQLETGVLCLVEEVRRTLKLCRFERGFCPSDFSSTLVSVLISCLGPRTGTSPRPTPSRSLHRPFVSCRLDPGT